MLSRLELAVLASLLQARRPSHAAALRPEVEARLGTSVNRGALARALAQLCEAGLLSERSGDPAPHGGPARVLYSMTPAGRERLLHEMRAFARLTRLRELSPVVQAILKNPPAGSKVAKAKAYGVDLNRLSRALVQSPQERYREAIEAMKAFRALIQAGVDFVVVGGLAANVRGSDRVTKDIDLVYHIEASNVRRLCKVLNVNEPRMLALGKPEGKPVTLTPELLKRHPLLQLSTKLGQVDILSGIAGFTSYRAIKNASEAVKIDGQSIPMLTREGVIKSKRAMKRPKDLDDVKQLEAVAELEAIDQAAQSLE